MNYQRLNKALLFYGICSRRKGEILIIKKKFLVNVSIPISIPNLGMKVLDFKKVAFGNISLGNLQVGNWEKINHFKFEDIK